MGLAGWLAVASAWLVCLEHEGVVDWLATWLGWLTGRVRIEKLGSHVGACANLDRIRRPTDPILTSYAEMQHHDGFIGNSNLS